MGVFVSAAAYAWLSHVLAWLLLPWRVAFGVGARALALWMTAGAALYFVRDPMSTMLVAGCAILLLAPLNRTSRAAFFLIAAPCLPVYLTSPLPFPGIDHLTVLTNYKIAVLILLVPLFWYARSKTAASRSISVAGVCLILYLSYTAVILTGTGNTTGGLRFIVDQFLVLAVPFFAIRSAIKTLDDVDSCFCAFLVVSVFLATVTLVASVKQWDFYSLLQSASVLTVPDLRSGFVRINATLSIHSLGFHLAAGLIVLQYLSSRLKFGWFKLNSIRFVLLAGIYFTDSRGAMGGLAVAGIVYILFLVKSRKWLLVLTALVSVGGVAGSIWLLTAEFPTDGNLGSFSYRQELLRTAIPYILSHPWFGDYNFNQSKAFEHLVQGQGIIDITNLYLQIALHYGLIGLVLFFTAVLAPLLALTMHALRQTERAPGLDPKKKDENAVSAEWRQAAGVITGVLSGWLFLVATTSDVGLTVHIGLVFAAMAQGLYELAKPRMARPRAEMWGTTSFAGSNLSTRSTMPNSLTPTRRHR